MLTHVEKLYQAFMEALVVNWNIIVYNNILETYLFMLKSWLFILIK